MPTLNLTPPEQPLRLYAGDNAQLTLNFWSDAAKTIGFDFTGYTAFAGSVRSNAGNVSNLTVNTVNMATGVIIITFDGAALNAFPKSGNRWDLQCVTTDSRPITLIQGTVTVEADNTP